MTKGSFSAFLLHIHPRLIPAFSAEVRFTWCLGGLAFWLFILEVITGLLLVLRYVPTISSAYGSIQEITHLAPYGFFVRNIHYWAGQAMVAIVVLHMIRVFWTGSFAPPRDLNWTIGLLLLVGTLLVDFTGYILVWDDRSLWAWTIARNLSETIPVLGSPLASIFFGPSELGDFALVRVYVWHVILLPGLLVGLLAWHFWKIRKDGISRPL
ncbi:MAG: cytochrome b N-terminal domain-containing protein [Desulfomonile tiedjei]|uniref:Cytochrome b N-terminal domain-containing protein n=1 Tax=Desulfomonile tiedjei TaxID=2358 RepID=A0A9D6Z5G2_9BACT|nr:cytochrome b N-terminal domain-containing protein [Desulfomonile tiedjei]